MVVLESLLTQDSRITHVVVFGTGKTLNGVIISPSLGWASGDFEPETFCDAIWATVEKVNNVVPKHSRLIRQMVLVENPSKPFVKTDKGTVRTRETLALYEHEISAAHSTLEGGAESSLSLTGSLDFTRIKSIIRTIVEKVCGRAVGEETDIFNLGRSFLIIRTAFQQVSKGPLRDGLATCPSNPVRVVASDQDGRCGYNCPSKYSVHAPNHRKNRILCPRLFAW